MPHTMRVSELMVPLSEYASVGEDETLERALRALRDAQKKLPPGKQPHRAILVRDGRGNIVGKIGHFTVLDTLLPWHEEEFQVPMLRRAWVSEELAHQVMDNLALLEDDLPNLCQLARRIRVGDMPLRPMVTIDHDVPIVVAMRILAERQTLSLLVRRANRIVGVLRTSDVFDYFSDRVLECDESPEEV